MEVTFNPRYSTADLIIESGNTKITEDVAYNNKVDDSLIEQLITVANEMSRYNNVSDVDFVVSIFEAFLNDSEREEFLERVSS